MDLVAVLQLFWKIVQYRVNIYVMRIKYYFILNDIITMLVICINKIKYET